MGLQKSARVRLPQYDIMRVVSMFLVVYVHSSFLFTFTLGNESAQSGLYWFTSLLALVCNALFFMVSGKFNLSQAVDMNKDGYGVFYAKKVIDLLVPILFYAIIFWVLKFIGIGVFGAWNDGTTIWDFGAFIHMVQELLMSSWWFVPTIFSLMIFTPFLGRMLKGLEHKEAYLMLALLFGCMAIVSIEKIIGHTSFLSKFLAPTFGAWAGVYILGYIIDGAHLSSRIRVALCTVATASVIIVGGLFVFEPQVFVSSGGGLDQTWSAIFAALLYPVLASAIFLFFKNVKVPGDRMKRLAEFVGNRAFGIYLIHFCFFFSYLQLLPDWLRGADDVVSGITKRIVITVIVYLASLAVATFVDLLIVNPVQKKLKTFVLGRLSRVTQSV